MKKTGKMRLLALMLVAAMILSVIPGYAQAAGNENLALGKPATASNVEGGTNFTADKAVDGNTTTASRWATDMNVTDPWIEIDLDDGSVVKQINIIFERSDANQNILAYKVEAYADGAYTAVYTHTEADGRCKQREKIILDEAVTADKLKLTITSYDGGQNPVWASVSVLEIEVFGAEIFSLDDVAQSLNDMAGTVITGDTLPLPEVPDGFTIEMNGADLEQIINNEGEVFNPLVDKVVNVSFKISDGTNSIVTGDIPVTVKGQLTQAEGKNAKPAIIPEIQEWYSDSTEKVAVSALTKVTYDDASLKAVVDEFVADYATFTGITLEASQGEAQANAFNFSLIGPTELLGDEGYGMEIEEDRITVVGGTTTGCMYGMQTILQMYKLDSEGYPIGMMRDYPRYQVRGLLLDMARKPIAMNMISDISRTMRYYKMNDLQLHLNDNLIFLEDYRGYDNAVDAYEAFRLESSLTNEAGEDPTAEDYYVTKAAMAEFIQSERVLGMNIVPEIDVPAHSLSFTKIWADIRVSDTGSTRPLVDHFDLTKPAAVAKIKEIFDDYTKGDAPTFDADTIVHVGADEFTYDKTAYRNYFNEIIPYVKETNTVRVWGSLTIIDDGVTEIVPEAIENVQMNIWNTGWADPQAMYNLGFDVINTIDGSSYMVPSGSYDRGGYLDLLNLSYLFSSFNANNMGSAVIPSGDDQMLGAVYAIWNDNIDTRACGLTESDMYYRFFDALPIFAEKTWAATGQEKGSATALTELSKEVGMGPDVNPYFQVESTGDTHASYDFTAMTDGSGNGRDLIAGTATIADGALVLGGGNSYVSTPITKIGNGNSLSFDITLAEAAKPGDILFETTPEYDTHDIRIMEDGTLGFTRELYDYSFGYTLPVGETVSIKIVAEQQQTSLYVDGELFGVATGQFVNANTGNVSKSGITNSTFALPLERIGSETSAIAATIDNVCVEALMDPADDSRDIPVEVLTATAGDWQTGYEATEGPANLVLDGDISTMWHTNWYGTSRANHWIQFELSEGYTVDGLRYQPREGSVNGRILGYEIQVSNDGTNFETVATGTWGNNTSWKVASFDGVQAKYVRLVSLDSLSDNANYVFASAAEIRLTGEKAASAPVEEADVTRLSGSGRCETAYLAANELKAALGVEKFDAVIIASGDNFADALAGSYLAAVKGAPILLYRNGYADDNATYIAENLKDGGTVYILGGTAAVPEEMETALAGYTVERVKGANRFETNLAILKEAGVGDKDILVATGYNFADSLSASATGMPILLVHNSNTDLTETQKAFLSELNGNNIVVIGGTGAVNEDLYTALEAYGDVERVKGSGREATSVALAAKYFDAPSAAVVAYSRNFPDGLCGGPLAYALGAPLLLTNTGYEDITAAYTADMGIVDGFVLGGTAAVSDEIVRTVFAMEADAEITVKR